MSEAGFDFNQMAIRMQLGKSKGGGDDGANEKSVFDFLTDALGSQAAGITSIVTGAPDLSQFGNTSVFKKFELSEGLHEKMINPMAGSFSAPGGFLYRVLSVLFKNREITDLAADVGAGGGDYSGGGGDYSGDGGGSAGGGGSGGEASASDIFGHGDIGGHSGGEATVNYGGHTYAVESMQVEALGQITPLSYGDAAVTHSADHGIAV